MVVAQQFIRSVMEHILQAMAVMPAIEMEGNLDHLSIKVWQDLVLDWVLVLGTG